MTEESIFFAALEKRTPAERAAYLDQACAADGALRERVEALLESHFGAASFLKTPAVQRVAEELNGHGCSGDTQEERTGGGDGQSLDFLSASNQPGFLGQLGHYEVLEVVGRGGMGIVLKALDQTLRRVVAIKVMAPELATSAIARRRFLREARAAAAVRDEHVIDIHAVEEANGLPYLVMEYISGVSLQDRLDQAGPLELKEILRIGMQTASGLAAAHAQGLIHRDIKPANVLLENGVERVKITDFGLARAADDANVTNSGVVAGTPQYMAPEQAEGKPVDQRADLFSLGSTLYALCTGHAPFRASGNMAVLKHVCEGAPRPIKEVNPEIPDWLIELIAKLHAKDPASRFQSAAEVAEVLGQKLAHLQHPSVVPRAVLATPIGGKVLGGRGRRHLWPIAASVTLLLLVGLGLAKATDVTNLTAMVIRIFTPDGTLVVELYDPDVKMTIEGDGGVTITGAARREVRLRPRTYRWRATKNGKVVQTDLVTISSGSKQSVKVGLQPADRRAATGLREPLAPGEVRRFVGHTDAIANMVLSKDGRRALSGSWDKTVRLWNVETGEETRRFSGHSDKVFWVALSPNCRRVLSSSGYHDDTVRLWDAETGTELRRWTNGIGDVAFSPDSRRLIFYDTYDRVLRLWDVESGDQLRYFKGPPTETYAIRFSPDGRRVFTGSVDKTVRLWDMETGEEIRSFKGHTDEIRCVAFSPDGFRALSGGYSKDRTVRLWDLESGNELHRFEGHREAVYGVAFSPNGRYALSGSGDRSVRLWDVNSGEELYAFIGHTDNVSSVAFTPDGRYALSSSADWTLRLWQLPKLEK